MFPSLTCFCSDEGVRLRNINKFVNLLSYNNISFIFVFEETKSRAAYLKACQV